MKSNNLPSKGRDISIEDKISIAQKVCDCYATNQYTFLSCIQQNGVRSESTWRNWLEIEEIEDLYNKAKFEKQATYHANLVEKASSALERHLEGWTKEVVETKGIPNQDTKGEIKITEIRRKEIYQRPSLQAAIFVLTNLDGETFTRNPEPYKAGDERIPAKIEFEIVGGSIAPVTSEDDISI